MILDQRQFLNAYLDGERTEEMTDYAKRLLKSGEIERVKIDKIVVKLSRKQVEALETISSLLSNIEDTAYYEDGDFDTVEIDGEVYELETLNKVHTVLSRLMGWDPDLVLGVV